ncbi:MAG: hypothetical protein HY699_09080 [Deltaproteobacteria bacterium]|nr:hypothetical protein [Deltaproteobacteria bacterium]
MTTPTAMRVLALTGRIVSPVMTAAAVMSLGLFAWRSWMRLRQERRWQEDWEAFRRQHFDPPA